MISRFNFHTFLPLLATLLSFSLVVAQQPGRGPTLREVRGVVKSVDVASQTVTIAMTGGGNIGSDKTFKLAPDAEIALGDGTQRPSVFTAGKLTDLAAGTLLTLQLADGSDEAVLSIIAQGPQLRG